MAIWFSYSPKNGLTADTAGKVVAHAAVHKNNLNHDMMKIYYVSRATAIGTDAGGLWCVLQSGYCDGLRRMDGGMSAGRICHLILQNCLI